jgi:hypothetical protein
MPGAPAAATARGQRLRDVLLDLLRTADLPAWPGCDGLTDEDVLLTYPASAAAGRVPDLRHLLCRHPDLAGELRALFGAPLSEPEPRP